MAKVKHSERAHALLSASGASRWINCTPSPRLEEELNIVDAGSDFAKEGTLAHEFGDLGLQLLSGQTPKKVIEKEMVRQRKNKLYTDEMEPQVEKYTDYVMEQLTAAQQVDDLAILSIEEKLDLTHLIEDGFGTGDAIVIADGTLEVIDLKYGKGIQVEADDNDQLKLYGLGALDNYDMMYDIHTVRLTIVQPRLDHISTWTIPVSHLHAWADKIVRPKAKMAYAGEGKTCAGDWCKWCKVKPRCRRLAEDALSLAKHEFKKPDLLEDDELLAVYKQIKGLTDWAAAVASFIKSEAIAGKKWEGYKLVEGRSVRKWADEKAVYDHLIAGYDADKIQNTKMKGIGDITKLVGKVSFAKHLTPFVVKPPGAPTLVPESDKRQAFSFNSAKDDFAD